MARLFTKGWTLKDGTGTVAAIVAIDMPQETVGEIPITLLADGAESFAPGLYNPGKLSLTIQYDPDDAGHIRITTAMHTSPTTTDTWTVTAADAHTTHWKIAYANAFPSSFKIVSVEQAKCVEADVEFTLSGYPTITVGS